MTHPLENIAQPFIDTLIPQHSACTISDIGLLPHYGGLLSKGNDVIFDYLKNKVIPHKIEVYKAGIELMANHNVARQFNVPIDDFMDNLLVHDASKFSIEEAKGYAYYDFASKEYDIELERAWHLHKMRNPHHPEYWLNPDRSGKCDPLPMPPIYIAEMVADWIGAGKTYGQSLEVWLPENIDTFVFHPQTAKILCAALNEMGFAVRNNGTYLFVD